MTLKKLNDRAMAFITIIALAAITIALLAPKMG